MPRFLIKIFSKNQFDDVHPILLLVELKKSHPSSASDSLSEIIINLHRFHSNASFLTVRISLCQSLSIVTLCVVFSPYFIVKLGRWKINICITCTQSQIVLNFTNILRRLDNWKLLSRTNVRHRLNVRGTFRSYQDRCASCIGLDGSYSTDSISTRNYRSRSSSYSD